MTEAAIDTVGLCSGRHSMNLGSEEKGVAESCSNIPVSEGRREGGREGVGIILRLR